MTQTFRKCGHDKTPDNTRSDGSCRFCGIARRRAARNADSAWVECQRDFPVDYLDKEMRLNSRKLLKALHREHPYVFHAAERSGRLVVWP